jgi:KipI family sensor histidine kinase inhibitor
MESVQPFTVEPAGDRAFLLRFGNDLSLEVSGKVLAASEAVAALDPAWLIDVVPAYASLLVVYDPLNVSPEAVEVLLRETAGRHGTEKGPGREVTVPVRYGGEDGPDLEEVARLSGLTPDQVVAIHTSVKYVVHLLGFKPGFPYMGTLDARIRLSRRPSPRPRVVAGTVAIAGAQTGIYPVDSPGGWRLLGRTPLRLFDPSLPEPFLFRPGDRVRFEAIP